MLHYPTSNRAVNGLIRFVSRFTQCCGGSFIIKFYLIFLISDGEKKNHQFLESGAAEASALPMKLGCADGLHLTPVLDE